MIYLFSSLMDGVILVSKYLFKLSSDIRIENCNKKSIPTRLCYCINRKVYKKICINLTNKVIYVITSGYAPRGL